jgi:Mg2+ and Co2+ transporter CorA
MQVLAVIVMIFIPLSFLADLWEMNFDTRTSP